MMDTAQTNNVCDLQNVKKWQAPDVLILLSDTYSRF